MKKSLTKISSSVYYYKDGERVEGVHKDITGDVSGIRGNVTGITGNVSDIYGDVSGIRGNVSGITGDVSGIRGDIDDCDITDEERKNGIDIGDLIK